MASLHPHKKSPFWYCAYKCANGRRRFRSTREKDRGRAELVCKAWDKAEAEQAPSKSFLDFTSSSNSNKPARVYFASSGRLVKIGVAFNPPYRVKSFRAARPDIKLLGHVAGGRKLEAQLHQQFSKNCLEGEWFRLTPKLKGTIKRLLKDELIKSTARLAPPSNNETPTHLLTEEWVLLPSKAQDLIQGLSPKTLLGLHAQGDIKIATVRKPGSQKAISRFVHLPSLLNYLETRVEQPKV